jgi:hypothetical protein
MEEDFVDEVAVRRALQGDALVWASLTRLERDEVVLRAAQKRRAEQAENAEWTSVKRASGWTAQYKGEPSLFPHPTRHPQWLVDVVTAAGYADVDSLLKRAGRIEKKRSDGG